MIVIFLSMIVIFLSIYGLLRMTFVAQPIRSTSTRTVATGPTSTPNLLPVSTAPTPEPAPTSTPQPTPTPNPLKSRVVKHRPNQFREGAISKEELSAIKNAIKTIQWSRNADPKAAADEDYAAIAKECNKRSAHYLLLDLITEAAGNDYQPHNEAANSAYITELNSVFEKGVKDEPEAQKPSSKRQ